MVGAGEKNKLQFTAPLHRFPDKTEGDQCSGLFPGFSGINAFWRPAWYTQAKFQFAEIFFTDFCYAFSVDQTAWSSGAASTF